MICIDTDCTIDFLKNKKEAIEVVRKYKDDLVTTDINIFEIFIGIYTKENSEKESQYARGFFDSISILDMNGWGEKAAEVLANLIKKGDVIEENDCFIASIMLSNGCNKIITRNKKHFLRIKGIEVIEY